MNQENRKRNGKGQFAANTSGNPAGRPTGSRNKSTSLLEGLLHAEGPAVLGKLVEMARARKSDGNAPHPGSDSSGRVTINLRIVRKDKFYEKRK